MKVKVKFFSSHRSATGKNELELELEDGITIDMLVDMLMTDYPKLKELTEFTILSLNHNFAKSSEVLKDGDEIALFPPVAGG